MKSNESIFLEEIREKTIKEMEHLEIKELERFNSMLIEEMLRFGKMIIEEIKRLKQLKVEELEKLKNMKINEINDAIYWNYRFQDKINKKKYFKPISDELDKFKKKEIKRFEKMKKEKTEKLKKLEIEEIDKQINLENSEFINNKNLIMYFDILMLGAFPPKNRKKYTNESNIDVIFEEVDFKQGNENTPIIIKCSLNDKISLLIEKYKEKNGNSTNYKKFMFENNELISDVTVEKTKLYNNCKIQVINLLNDNI